MSSYVQKCLAPDERVIYAAQLHWIVYLQGLIFIAGAGLFGYYAPRIAYVLFGDATGDMARKPLALVALLLVLIGLMLMLGAYVRVASTELVITDRRVIAKYGFISRATFEIMINRVTGVNFDQTLTGRMLGFGTIIVRGAGGDISPIDAVDNPQMFHNELMASVEKMRSG